MDPSSVPLLAWHFVAVQNSVNPMLAFCRGDVVYFLLVSPGWSVLLSVVTSHAHIQGLSLYLSDSMIAEHAGTAAASRWLGKTSLVVTALQLQRCLCLEA